MSKSARVLVIGGSAVVLLAVVLFFRPHKALETQLARTQEEASTEAPPTSSAPADEPRSVSPNPAPNSSQPPPAAPGSNWSDKVDTILGANVPESDKAKELLGMFPNLPPDGQEAVANHLSNLLPNEEYSQLAKFVTNASLPPEVLDVLLRDALNRPNALKLPVLLEVARNPQHPKASEAKETLTFLLGEDEGDDWVKWQGKLEEWLKANPD